MLRTAGAGGDCGSVWVVEPLECQSGGRVAEYELDQSESH